MSGVVVPLGVRVMLEPDVAHPSYGRELIPHRPFNVELLAVDRVGQCRIPLFLPKCTMLRYQSGHAEHRFAVVSDCIPSCASFSQGPSLSADAVNCKDQRQVAWVP